MYTLSIECLYVILLFFVEMVICLYSDWYYTTMLTVVPKLLAFLPIMSGFICSHIVVNMMVSNQLAVKLAIGLTHDFLHEELPVLSQECDSSSQDQQDCINMQSEGFKTILFQIGLTAIPTYTLILCISLDMLCVGSKRGGGGYLLIFLQSTSFLCV